MTKVDTDTDTDTGTGTDRQTPIHTETITHSHMQVKQVIRYPRISLAWEICLAFYTAVVFLFQATTQHVRNSAVLLSHSKTKTERLYRKRPKRLWTRHNIDTVTICSVAFSINLLTFNPPALGDCFQDSFQSVSSCVHLPYYHWD